MQIKSACGTTAVKAVAQNWKASACKVNANLVGAAGVKAAFYKKTFAAFYGDGTKDPEVCF